MTILKKGKERDEKKREGSGKECKEREKRGEAGTWSLGTSFLNMAATSRRALHFVFKVGNRNTTAKFYRDILGMKVS